MADHGVQVQIHLHLRRLGYRGEYHVVYLRVSDWDFFLTSVLLSFLVLTYMVSVVVLPSLDTVVRFEMRADRYEHRVESQGRTLEEIEWVYNQPNPVKASLKVEQVVIRDDGKVAGVVG